MNTPNKRVEEIIKECDITNIFLASELEPEEPAVPYERVMKLVEAITQHNQTIMNELLEALEKEKYNNTYAEMCNFSEYEVGKVNGYNQALTQAQTIIKSLTPPIKSDVRPAN